MIKVLCIVASMNTGGAETFLMKILRSIDTKKFKLDFCVSEDKKGFYDDEIIKLGGEIYKITPKTKGIYKFIKELSNVIRKNNYDCVIRIGASSLVSIDLWVAKLCKVKCRILRSSNAGTIKGKKHDLFNYIFRIPLTSVANVKIAPSMLAAEYTFSPKIAHNESIILNNGLDIEKFKFNEQKRMKIRKKLNIDNYTVIGHIGRFNIQKNHEYLLKVFRAYIHYNNNAILLLIGCGELEDKIKHEVKKLKLEDKVLMLGTRDDINFLMMAMDILIFPSFFEGMPNVVIEAQSTGLPCLISDKITPEVQITDLVYLRSIEEHPDNWAKYINDILSSCNKSREIYSTIMITKEYDIKSVTKKLEEIIEEKIHNEN